MMVKPWSNVAFSLAFFTICLVVVTTAQPYDTQLGYGSNDPDASELDYLENFRDMVQHAQKRVSWIPKPVTEDETIIRNGRGRVLCIDRGMSCSIARNACCMDWECRCNIFGSNCKKRFFFPNDYVKRRICVPPQMSCNTLPNSCCGETTCRCNLWGQNCRCLRMGFFQRWGK